MKAAFFHDHRFGRDPAGAYYSNGALPYPVFSRYLKHFDSLVVVARVECASRRTRTLASGPGIQMACVERVSRLGMLRGAAVRRHVRSVLDGVDCAIVRLPSMIGRIACGEAIRSGRPWMVEVVGDVWQALWHHGSLAGKLLAGPLRLQLRSLVRQAPFALYVSQRYLQDRYPCGGRSVGCADVAIAPPRREVLERRLARLGSALPGAETKLGLVGSLDVDYKGHDAALRALAQLDARVHLSCLGGGDPERWRRLAAQLGVGGRVEFAGTLPGDLPVLEWMDQLDLLLVPSLTEGLPRALIEGMSRALPAVGADVGGIPELLGPSCVHRPGDPPGLAAAILRLLDRPDEMRAQACRNWQAAAAYSMPVLEARRDRFLGEFRAFAAISTTPGRGAVRAAEGDASGGETHDRRSARE